MNNQTLHYFQNEHIRMAYEPRSMSFYRITDTDALPPTPSVEESSPSPTAQSAAPPYLERLVLIVTTYCNLRCRYCYAEGGDYGMGLQHMSPDIAQQALDWTLQLTPAIKTIQFFGGEPTLNWDVVEYVCAELQQRHNAGQLAHLPQYAIVTNGVLQPPQLEKLITQYPMHFNYSIDGPVNVHDSNRISIDGKGSFDRALKHFQQLQQAGNISLGVEMTITPQGLTAGYGIWEIAQFSRQQLGLSEPHIVPVQGPTEGPFAWNGLTPTLIASYRAATRAALNSLLSGDYTSFSFVTAILRSLIMRQGNPLLCPAGAGTLAVDTQGDIYPCFMFAGEPQFKLGNVTQAFDRNDIIQKLESFAYYNYKQNHSNCQSCWAQQLCTGCMGENWLRTGNLNGESPLMCQLAQAVAEEVMLFLGETQSDPQRWREFVTQYRAQRLDQRTLSRAVI